MTRILQIILLAAILTSTATAADYAYTEWMTASQLTQKLNQMNENRMFPGTVEGRVFGEEIRYRAKFIPFLPGMNYFRSRWGMSDDWYTAYTERLTRQGFKEFSHSVFRDLGGNTVHQATWVLLKSERQPTSAPSQRNRI